MKNRLFAATTLVFALVCVSDPALSLPQSAQPQECGNLAQYIPRLAQEFGWTREQAIGALANFAHESRGRAIEQIGMPAGAGGFGWAQWTGARRYAFMAFARANGMSPTTDAANYAFLAHELRTSFAQVAQRMRTARTAAEATVIFARDYEGAFGPGAITALASRHQWARVLGAASGGAVVAAATPAVVVAQPAFTPMVVAPQRAVVVAPTHRWYVAARARPAVMAIAAPSAVATPTVRQAMVVRAATTFGPRPAPVPGRGYGMVRTNGQAFAVQTRYQAYAARSASWSRAAVTATRAAYPYARVASLRSGYYGYWVAAR